MTPVSGSWDGVNWGPMPSIGLEAKLCRTVYPPEGSHPEHRAIAMDATNRCSSVEIAGRIRDQRAPGCVGPPVCAAGKGMQNGKLAARGQFVDSSTTIVIKIGTVTRRSGYAVEIAGRITDKSGIRKAAVGSTLKGIENGISLRRCRLYAGGQHSENSCKDCHNWDSPSIDHCDLLASMQIGSGISFLALKMAPWYSRLAGSRHRETIFIWSVPESVCVLH